MIQQNGFIKNKPPHTLWFVLGLIILLSVYNHHKTLNTLNANVHKEINLCFENDTFQTNALFKACYLL